MSQRNLEAHQNSLYLSDGLPRFQVKWLAAREQYQFYRSPFWGAKQNRWGETVGTIVELLNNLLLSKCQATRLRASEE